MSAIKQIKNSFSYATEGLVRVYKEEKNFRIQIWFAVVVIVLMFYFKLTGIERGVLLLAIAMVLVLELMNSVFERLVDLVKPRIHYQVKQVKDVMAAAVLITAILAVLIGFAVLWPYVSTWLFE